MPVADHCQHGETIVMRPAPGLALEVAGVEYKRVQWCRWCGALLDLLKPPRVVVAPSMDDDDGDTVGDD